MLDVLFALDRRGWIVVALEVHELLQAVSFREARYGTFAMLWTVTALGGADARGLELVAILLASLVAAMALSAIIALFLERVAYRPLIKRNAPRLIALISAIGASFVLDRLVQGDPARYQKLGQADVEP